MTLPVEVELASAIVMKCTTRYGAKSKNTVVDPRVQEAQRESQYMQRKGEIIGTVREEEP